MTHGKRKNGYCVMIGLLVMAGLIGTGCQTTGDRILQAKYMVEVQGRPDKAIPLLEKELSSNPDSAATWYWLGVAHSKRMQFDKTVKALEQAFALDLYKTYHPSAYEYLGQAYVLTRQYQKGLDACNHALQLKPNNVTALEYRARARIGLRDFQTALADLNVALSIFSNAKGARFVRADAYYKMKQYDKAMADYDYLIGMESHPWSFYLTGRGWTYYMMGEFQKAMWDFDSALKNASPADTLSKQDAYRGKAFASLGLGLDEDALPFIEKAKELPGYDPRKDLALIYFLLGDKETVRKFGGNDGFIGIEIGDYRDGAITGVEVARTFQGGPAESAGIVPGDIIVEINGQPVSNSMAASGMIRQVPPGKKMVATMIKKGHAANRVKREIAVAGASSFLDQDPLISRLVEQRRSLAGTPQRFSGAPPRDVSMEDTGGGGLQASAQEPVIELDSVEIIPESVPPGSRFKVKMSLYAEDPTASQSKVAVTLHYTILRDGRVLKEFKPEKFRVTNGYASIITKKTKAGRTKGNYSVEIELELGGKTAVQTAEFVIE